MLTASLSLVLVHFNDNALVTSIRFADLFNVLITEPFELVWTSVSALIFALLLRLIAIIWILLEALVFVVN